RARQGSRCLNWGVKRAARKAPRIAPMVPGRRSAARYRGARSRHAPLPRMEIPTSDWKARSFSPYQNRRDKSLRFRNTQNVYGKSIWYFSASFMYEGSIGELPNRWHRARPAESKEGSRLDKFSAGFQGSSVPAGIEMRRKTSPRPG